MKRTIMTYGGYFERFIMTLSYKERKKIDYILSLLETEDRIPKKFIRLIRDGMYELRICFEGNIYRVFFIFDDDCIVVLFNGFTKKSPKTRFLRGRLELEDGVVCMKLPKDQGNIVLSSTLGCNVMAVVPAGSGPIEAGTVLKGFLI